MENNKNIIESSLYDDINNSVMEEERKISFAENGEVNLSASNRESPKRPKKSSLKFFFVFLGIILLGLAGYQAWSKFFSEEAKEAEKYREFFKALESAEKKHADDKFGGATPEETIALFILS